VWHRKFGQWTRIGNPGTRQLVADAGVLYTLEDNDDVLLYNKGQWSKIDTGTGTRMISADRSAQDIQLFLLKNSGQIFHYKGQNVFGQGLWNLVDDGTGTRQIEAAGGMLFALKDNGNIWRMSGTWSRVNDGAGSKQIEADGRFLYVLKDNGNIWMMRDDQWLRVDDGLGTRMIDSAAGLLLVLKDNGNVFEGQGALLGLPAAPISTRAAHFNALHGE
jgi:hypothetical protein